MDIILKITLSSLGIVLILFLIWIFLKNKKLEKPAKIIESIVDSSLSQFP